MKPLVYITGAGGYLGMPLVNKFLQDRKYNVLMSFDNINETNEDQTKADIVIHLAAKLPSYKGDPKVIVDTNLEATKKIVANKCKPGTHFIFLSTDYVFKSDPDKENDINDFREPETVYGQSKAAAEDFLLEQDLNVTILRTSMLYGYDHPRRTNFFKFLHEKVSNNEKIELFEDVFSRPTHVGDLINFIDMVIEEKINGVIHACGPAYINRYDLGKVYCHSNGHNPDLLEKTEMPKGGRWPTALNLKPSKIFLDSIRIPLETGVVGCLTKF
tara:strand:- start:1839 stop:2654 length:816 start_codon:yes stop_codon:yes gene_type:complete